jgi:hypothetical protein
VTGTGLVIDGKLVAVDGLSIVNVEDDKRAALKAADCRPRATPWVRQIILHTTKGIWPQHVIPGAGKPGKHLDVADYWGRDPEHSGAHLTIGRAGEVACLADLIKTAAYHATVSNEWSVGIEAYQESSGGIHEAVLDSTVKLVVALVKLLGIQFQVPGKAYRGGPMARMVAGGPTVVGVLGHRDNTNRRGRGDPGDELIARLVAAGAEPIITDGGNDLAIWQRRQRNLGMSGLVDGIPGPATTQALRARGFPGGVFALGSAELRASVDRREA